MPEGATEAAMVGTGAGKAGCRPAGAKLELNVVAIMHLEVIEGEVFADWDAQDEEDEPMLSRFH